MCGWIFFTLKMQAPHLLRRSSQVHMICWGTIAWWNSNPTQITALSAMAVEGDADCLLLHWIFSPTCKYFCCFRSHDVWKVFIPVSASPWAVSSLFCLGPSERSGQVYWIGKSTVSAEAFTNTWQSWYFIQDCHPVTQFCHPLALFPWTWVSTSIKWDEIILDGSN